MVRLKTDKSKMNHFKNLALIINDNETHCEVVFIKLSQAITIHMETDVITIFKKNISEIMVSGDKVCISTDPHIVLRFGTADAQYNFLSTVFPERDVLLPSSPASSSMPSPPPSTTSESIGSVSISSENLEELNYN